MEKRAAKAAAIVPFEQAAAQVSAAGAIRLDKWQAEELAICAAADFEAFYASRLPEPCPPETGLLLTCDGSAFPVLPGALRPATAKAAQARAATAESGWPDDPADLRKSRKRTAELAAVADIPPAPRIAEDILTALFGPARSRSQDAPKPASGPEAERKTLFASVRRPAAEVIADAFAEAHRRDPGRARPWLAVIDGNCHQIQTVTSLAAEYQVKVPILIDLIHVLEPTTCGRPRAASSIPVIPRPAPGSGSRPPRSWPGSTATSAPESAAAPPPGDTARRARRHRRMRRSPHRVG